MSSAVGDVFKTKLSPHFTVGDLSVTSQVPAYENVPDAAEIENLRKLAMQVLEPLYARVGPFKIESGFRSPAVNAKVGGSNTSYHSRGLAADIKPTSMSADAFFTRVVTDPQLRKLAGEFILNSYEMKKTPAGNIPTGKAIHVSIAGKDTDTMYRDPASGKYVNWSKESLQNFIDENRTAVAIGGAGLAILALVFVAANR